MCIRDSLKNHLIFLKEWSEEQHAAQERELKLEIRNLYKEAEKMGNLSGDTHVDPLTMFEQVYGDMPKHLKRQRANFLDED